MSAEEQFNRLMNFGSGLEGILLIGGPFILLCIIGIGFAVFLRIKRKKESSEFAIEMTMEDPPRTLEEEFSGKQPISYSDTENFKTPKSTSKQFAQKKKGRHEASEDTALQDASVDRELIDAIKNTDRQSWLSKLTKGLGKTRDSLQSSISSLLTGKSKIDENTLENLHEILYRADIGVSASDKLVEQIRLKLSSKETADWESVKTILRQESLSILNRPTQELNKPDSGPWIILMVGVNGAGKTTTIGKLAAHFTSQDKSVLLCAADTFRAAAIDQLKVWGNRIGAPVIAHKQGADPAAVAFDAVKSAVAKKTDVLLIDTAGRLHSKNDLMDELNKITRVIKRESPQAPHEVWLVIDATTGQNANAQVKAFKEAAAVSGLIVTKLDGTAKGGVILSVCQQFDTPIRYIGVGEKAEDLRDFDPEDFVNSIF